VPALHSLGAWSHKRFKDEFVDEFLVLFPIFTKTNS